jgi:SagB-type dehydrogenase family enzyme
MSPIPRPPLADRIIPYDAIPVLHNDCVAPGIAIREVRPPLTEFSPLPDDFPTADLPDPDGTSPFEPGEPITQLLLNGSTSATFSTANISRDRLWNLARTAFRWGSSYPFFPDGSHVALVRPLWIITQVTGIDRGAWYYNPVKDAWCCLRQGDYARDVTRLTLSNPAFENATAACFLIANLYRLMAQAGPDLYRLAHLEAGTALQRLELGARAIGLACSATTMFQDEEIRRFFGLDRTFWHPLAVAAIGTNRM